MDVIDKIAAVKTKSTTQGMRDVPEKAITILSIRRVEPVKIGKKKKG